MKNYKSAINSFNEAIRLNPKFSEAYISLGNVKNLLIILMMQLKIIKAISIKNNIIAQFNLAVILRAEKIL